MTLGTGSRLGPYEILSPLGAGGMGEVYRARDTRLDRTVAVKVLPSHLSSSPDVRQRFEREAKTISRFSHPHICALYDVGREGGVEYLVMEYLEGETLSDRLARGPLPLEQTLRFGQEIADALDKAHRQGIVHRDLKPGNVMLTKTGVKLLDFGLAKGIAGTTQPGATSVPTEMGSARNLTQEGTILGTFQYMSPEQLEGKEADARSDIFAFGAVLYEMATGRKAFTGSSQASLISAILRDEPQPISQVQPTSPPAFDRVVKTCLAKDAEDRWQSAGDLKRELRWIVEGSQAGAAPGAALLPARRRSSALPWSLAAAALVAVAALAVQLVRSSRERPPALHAFLVPPPGTAFQLNGDEAAPPVLSPDGASVVYGADGKLWIESLSRGGTSPLSSTEGAKFPFWSPDSRRIGFFAEGKLKIVDAGGGPTEVLADAPTPRGGAWGPSGMIVFAPDYRGGLLRVPASGGPATALTALDAAKHTTHRWPCFTPDGKSVLFLAANHANPRSEESGIYAVGVGGGAARRILTSYGSAQPVPGWLLTMRDTSLMAWPFDGARVSVTGQPVRIATGVHFDAGTWRGVFTASRGGTLVYQVAREAGGQLVWLDADGRRIASLGERTEAYALRVSPDGRRASVLEGDPNNDIWIYDLERGVRNRLTTGGRVLMSPVWSPDGRELMFVGGEDAIGTGVDYVLDRIASDGSGARRTIARSNVRIETTDWSGDGKYVLVDKGPIGLTDIWVYPVEAPDGAFPLLESAARLAQGQFSPDGRWVAYCSFESGRFEVNVTAFPAGGPRVRISARGGEQPHWSRDGRTLYFVTFSGDELMAASVDGSGPQFRVLGVRSLFPVNLFVGPRVSSGFQPSPDGKRFLVNSAGDVEAPRVAVVSHWTSELPR